MSTDARSEAFAASTRFLVTDSTVGDTLQRIAEIMIKAIPSAEVAGITMLDDRSQPITAIYTDKLSPEVDAAQYDSGRGPVLRPGTPAGSCASTTLGHQASTPSSASPPASMACRARCHCPSWLVRQASVRSISTADTSTGSRGGRGSRPRPGGRRRRRAGQRVGLLDRL